MKYENMLTRAKEELPELTKGKERFEIPKVKGHIQGNKTVLRNFSDIAKAIGREPDHLLKFILKEMATPGEIKKKGTLIGRKVPASFINEKIEEYVNTYVLCNECGKPDTKLKKEGKFLFLNCMACGARASVPSLK